MRKLLGVLLGLFALGGGVAVDAYLHLHTGLPIDRPTVVEVPRGVALGTLLDRWLGEGLLENRRQLWYLSAYNRITGSDKDIKTGEYRISPGLSAVDLTSLLVSGRALMHELLIIEGWTFKQALVAINADQRLEQPQAPWTTESVMQALGHPGLHPEGRFYPDTYRFPRGSSGLVILRQAFGQMQRVQREEWEARGESSVMTSADDALVLASIIERETGLASERGEIAGVFTRRLVLGMRLQTDPTVIYGMGDTFDGNLRRRDLQADTPYNTYTRKGLPPTPICLPGRASIRAALHPEPGDTLYFVARGDGSHKFSATVEEHNAAVRKYQLKGRKS